MRTPSDRESSLAVKKFSDSNLERDKEPVIQPFQTRFDPPALRFHCPRLVSIRLDIVAIGAIYEALESESGEATITSGPGGTKSNSSKLWSSELSKGDDSCDDCVVSWEFIGNPTTAVLGPSNTALFAARMHAGTGPAYGCDVVSGTAGRGALVAVGAAGEISCMRHIRRTISGDVM